MTELPRYQLFIDNQFVEPLSGQYLSTDDPYTGKAWAQVASGDASDVERAVYSADAAFRAHTWAG